jgi:mRNA interferase RelE/StbE
LASTVEWTVEFQLTAQKQIRKLNRATQARILGYFRNRVLAAEHPRKLGKPLHGDQGDLWRCRIGDHRAICKIEDERLVVLVLVIGHRHEVYR